MSRKKKTRGFNRCIVIDGFSNETQLRHYFYIIDKYGIADAANYFYIIDKYGIADAANIAICDDTRENEDDIKVRIVDRETLK